MEETLSFILHLLLWNTMQLLMHVFYLATLLLMTKLLYIHGQSFLEYSLPVLMDPQH